MSRLQSNSIDPTINYPNLLQIYTVPGPLKAPLEKIQKIRIFIRTILTNFYPECGNAG